MSKTDSKMLTGSPFLLGDNSTPGVKIHPEVKDQLDLIFRKCREFGLDFYPTIIEFCTYDDISEIASYGGFPIRYPHWSFGMEYEEMSRGYEYGMHRISEMVINTNPCVIYCLDSNALVDNVDVIAHALGHNDFFKNNVFFKGTNTDMLNKFANHSQRIRKYMARWGEERVTEFIDCVRRIDTLIDASKEWRPKPIKKMQFSDRREVQHPERRVPTNEYMDEWVNSSRFIEDQKERIQRKEAAKELEIFSGPQKDIFGYLKDHAPLRPWQQDIVSMLYEEAIYFAPQRLTKMINEGWASYVDFKLMCGEGLCAAGQDQHDMGIIHYAKHKMLVLGGQWSQNPYKLGFELLMDIEDRWNKGRFGTEWEECDDIVARKNWNKNLGLGRDKVFEVRACHNDLTLINEFFTADFCEKMQYYERKRFPSQHPDYEWEWRITSRDHKEVKKKLLQRYVNGGLPDIRLVDPNHKGKGYFLMEHQYTGSPLYDKYARESMVSIFKLWKRDVALVTQNQDGDEMVYYCNGKDSSKNVFLLPREEYEELNL